MVPMRNTRLAMAFPALMLVVCGIDQVSIALTANSQQATNAATLLTAALIVSYAWVAPWIQELVALPSSTKHVYDLRRLSVLVKRLSRMNGIATPKLVLIEHESHVAMGVGLPGHSIIFVTTGLCQRIQHDSLRGVLAHEIAHITLRHALFQSIVFGTLYAGKVVLNLPPEMAPLIILGYLAFMRQCEYAADAGAASMIGPMAMKSTLRDLARMVGESKTPSWIVELLSTHPSFAKRISAIDRKHGQPVMA
jgi:Zn-dependent protease with chaperone function